MSSWAHKDPYDTQRWDRAPPGAPSILMRQGAWWFIAKPLFAHWKNPEVS